MLGRHCRWEMRPRCGRGPTVARCHPPFAGPIPRRSPAARCHLPLSPHLPIAYPTPMPTARSMSSHFQGPTPASEQHPQAGAAGRLRVRPLLGRLCRLALPPCLCGCDLFPFVDFGPFSAEALGPRSARALADTTCSPLSTFPTPPSGAVRPPASQCLADTVRLPLSTCPARLNPKLRRAPPGTGRPEIRAHTIPIKSNRPPALPVDTRAAVLLPSHAHIDQTQRRGVVAGDRELAPERRG